MTVKTIVCSNSLEVPTIQKKIEIDLEGTVNDLKKILRDEFGLKNLKFIVFLRSNKEWQMLEDDKAPLSDYPFDGEKLMVDIKRIVSLSKFHQLFKEIGGNDVTEYPYGILQVDMLDADKTRQMLVNTAKNFIDNSLRDPANVSFSIPSRSGDNIGFDEETELVLLGKQRIDRQFRNLSSVKSVQQLTALMKTIHDILARDIHSTKRDVFYNDVNAFENQNTSDNLIEDMGAMLQVTRDSMNITASSKGIVIGHLEFMNKSHLINCQGNPSGQPIASNIDDVDDLQSDAEFVLVVEKDAIFQRLAEDQFFDYIPSIIITAKGQPDMATRKFIKKIYEDLSLPILAIMDADVYGFEILRVYSVGSKALSFEASNLAVPDIRWLGLLPTDLDDDSGFGIPKDVHLKMTKSDEHRTKLLLDEEFVKRKPAWKNQIQHLLDRGIKAEIQALNARDPQFITNQYLPTKIENADFI
ncbi:MAG: hypothetical protein ACXAB7_01655 [Candidatus Kariarchaeaceae archaeon]|jgi:meiotic recombination protein SPO11